MKRIKEYCKKIKITAIIVFLPAFMFLIFSPLEIYYGNINDFEFVISDFLPIFLSYFLVTWILISFLMSLLPTKLLERVLVMITAFSVISYIQNMFINNKISGDGGTLVNWAARKKLTTINTMVWIVVFLIILVLFMFLKKRIGIKCIVIISLIFLFIQLAATGDVLLKIKIRNKHYDTYRIDVSQELSVAPNNNIIILNVDWTRNDLVENYFDNNPESALFLKDFTFYTNYDSRYWPTFPSVAHLFTGEEVDCTLSEYEWSKKAWNSDRTNSFFDKLHRNGFTVNLYEGSINYVFVDTELLYNKFDNIYMVKEKPRVDKHLMFSMLEKMSIYRYAPDVLKPRFEVNMEYYRDVVRYSEVDNFEEHNDKVYKKIHDKGLEINYSYDNLFMYKHFWGMHIGHDVDSNFERMTGDISWDETFEAVLKILEEYIDELKRLGLYDKATIIIMSDHGDKEIEGRQCIFMIKLPNENNKSLIKNNSPICSDDFQATIMEIVGESTDEYGTSIFDWNEDMQRKRTTFIREDGLIGYEYNGDIEELRKLQNTSPIFEYVNLEW